LFAGFRNKKLGVLGALGSIVTFLCTVTVIPFMPDGWAKSAGGFPAMVGNVAFPMKDVVCWRCQDLLRVTLAAESARYEKQKHRDSTDSVVKSMQAKI
jgi:uncharacterized membrane protein YkgB